MSADLSPARIEGTLTLPDGRRLGFAEFGPARGRPVFWFHGTPGARRQIPEARPASRRRARRAHHRHRPARRGDSTPHLYGSHLRLGPATSRSSPTSSASTSSPHRAVSGGGPVRPRVLRRAARPGRRGRDPRWCRPDTGRRARRRGARRARSRRSSRLVERFRLPLSLALTGFVWALRPFASPAFELYARISPEGDRRIFARPEIKAMFIDDIVSGSRRGMSAPVLDLVLFTRPWGFSLADIKVPIRWWHGDADNIVPLAHGVHVPAAHPRRRALRASGREPPRRARRGRGRARRAVRDVGHPVAGGSRGELNRRAPRGSGSVADPARLSHGTVSAVGLEAPTGSAQTARLGYSPTGRIGRSSVRKRSTPYPSDSPDG